MTTHDHFRRLERIYRVAPVNAYYRPEIRIDEGRAEIRIPVREEFFHAFEAVHGSVYFKALDDAAFFAVNSLVPEVWVVTASMNVHLLAPVREGELVARGEVVHRGRSSYLARAELQAGEKRLAHGLGTFVRSSVPIEEG